MDDPAAAPPGVEIASGARAHNAPSDTYVFSRAAVIVSKDDRRTAAAKSRAAILEEKLKAIAQVLASFGLLDRISKSKQEQMLRAIFEILYVADE
jgi:hypothetical protein